MTPHLRHADRPHESILPRARSGHTREDIYGKLARDEALLDRLTSYLPKLFWITAGLGVGGAVGIIAWHLGWFAWRMVG